MNLIKSISSIASSSVLSQLIGAFSVWLISHRYGMAEVGHYAMIYSNVLIGAQVCTFASQLLIPRQEDHELEQNVVFCLLQSLLMAIPWAVITGLIFDLNIAFLYLLTFGYALVLVAENLSLRGGNYPFLTFQRIAVSLVVAIALLVMPNPTLFYLAWMVGILLLLVACLSPVMIIGNAVRNSIFSKWSMDFRNHTFNYPEYKKVRLLLLGAAAVCILGIWIFYPLVMRLGFSEEWLNSIPTSRYMLPYLFAALAVSPLTVIELIFGSRRYFLRIQIEQLLIIVIAFIALPYFGVTYEIALLTFSFLTFARYLFILLKMNQRAKTLSLQEQKICS